MPPRDERVPGPSRHCQGATPARTLLMTALKVSTTPAGCPCRGHAVKGTVETGVDTALATDQIQAAIHKLFDDAILASAAADLVPTVEFVPNRTGKRVIHAHIRPRGQGVRNACRSTCSSTISWPNCWEPDDRSALTLLATNTSLTLRCRSRTMRSIDQADVATDTSGRMIAGLLSRRGGHCRAARAMRILPPFIGTVRSIWLCLVELSNRACGFTPHLLAPARPCSGKWNRELH